MNQYVTFFTAHWELALLFFVAFIWILLAEVNERKMNSWGVEPQKAVELINKNAAIIFDLRDVMNFEKGYIVGAKRVDFKPAADDPKAILKITPHTTCLFVCSTGQASSKAVHVLRKNGYTAAYSLIGGISSWQRENFPMVKQR